MSTILSTIRVTQGRHEFSNWVNTLGGGGAIVTFGCYWFCGGTFGVGLGCLFILYSIKTK